MNDSADLERLHHPPHPLLLEIEARGARDGVAIASREVGRLLATLTQAMQASRILQVGTGYGYATLWMAFAQPQMGKIWTIEPDRARAAVALEYFRRSGENDDIEILTTPASQLFTNFPHRNFDIALLDAGASEDRDDLDPIVSMLKLSGLVIALGSRNAGPAFARAFLTHPQLDATILSFGEGLAIGARKR